MAVKANSPSGTGLRANANLVVALIQERYTVWIKANRNIEENEEILVEYRFAPRSNRNKNKRSTAVRNGIKNKRSTAVRNGTKKNGTSTTVTAADAEVPRTSNDALQAKEARKKLMYYDSGEEDGIYPAAADLSTALKTTEATISSAMVASPPP